MTDEQKAASVTDLQEQGNQLYYDRQYKDASQKYLEALSRLENLMNKESPGTPEMEELRKKKAPLLLNHGMCKQKTREFYEAIKYNNYALEIEPENVKGLFRRGQCYKETSHWKEARVDLKRALKLDATLQKSVKFELECVNTSEEVETAMERTRCQRMLKQKDDGGAPKSSNPETSLDKQKRLVTELLEKTRLGDEAKGAEVVKLASKSEQPGPSVSKAKTTEPQQPASESEQPGPAPGVSKEETMEPPLSETFSDV